MKKIYTIISATALTFGMNAQSAMQTRTGSTNGPVPSVVQSNPVFVLSPGDTLLYIPFVDIFVNPTDSAAFVYQTEDLDGFSTSSTNNYPPDFTYFYSLQPSDYHPWENQLTDSSFFSAATSWFDNDPAQADNWMEFGPITIPAGGATLRWFVKTNPSYRDGYEVLLSSSGLSNYNDFNNAPIYSRPDLFPSTTTATDTVWQPVTATIPGGTQYIAFHHNATGMDVIYFDEILITENFVGVPEINQDFTLSHNCPNPANGSTIFNYNLLNNSDVAFNVYDITGKVVYTENLANQSVGAHRLDINTTELADGIYFYSMTANGQKVTRKMVVANN